MKKILLLLATVLLIGFNNSTNAQACSFGNLGVKVNSTSPGTIPGTCVINFDFYFDIDHNGGGKYFYIHIWPTSLHPAFNYAKPPTTSLISGGNGALDNSLTSFGYYHFQSNLSPVTSYLPDPTNVPQFQTGYTLTEIQGTPDRYTAHNLVITLPQGCNISQSLSADAWESQSDHSQTVACFSANQKFYLNDPIITGGLLFCQVPRTYKFDISTLSATAKTVNYEVRIDDGDGIYNAVKDTMIIKSGTGSITSSTPYQSGIQSYLPYSNTKPYSDKSLWVIVLKNGTDIPNDVYSLITNSCAPLPVSLYSFSASRAKMEVNLKWTTASENNNKGFYIERITDNQAWQQIAFVATKADLGNSSTDLNYSFTDLNATNGLSQYRLRQVDIDQRFTLSDTRIVKGLDQLFSINVFPNPSHNGEIILVMDKADQAADIKLIDMSGKIVAEWNHFTGNRLQIHAVSSGVYVLNVWIEGEKMPQILKVIVTK